ncbi:hypothetical protein [Kitasatospora sp. NPDC017646]|uniref:hypothetical protein n=1 Tax=Kitasatospora sp. NPDC017646 TaxID=3364024 RepID=UPI0037A951D7
MSVAIDDLAGRLRTSLATVQWVTTAYLLARLLALGLFLAGSVLCAAVWNAPGLIAFRVLQGVGGGMMTVLLATLVIQAAVDATSARSCRRSPCPPPSGRLRPDRATGDGARTGGPARAGPRG